MAKNKTQKIPSTIKLDKDREIKFTMPAIVALDDVFGINIFARGTYDDFPPSKLVSLIWAGQMYTPGALRRDRVSKYLPTDTEGYMRVCLVVALAINEALKDKTAPTESADAKKG